MGSMAFCYDKKKSDSASNVKPSAVMNFNLWTQCSSSEDSFIDIGFLVSNISASSKLHFYMPFPQAKIQDISKTIKDSKLISAIFNEKYSVVDSSNTDNFWVVLEAEKVKFVIYSWNEKNNGSVSQRGLDHGTLITIDTEKMLKEVKDVNDPQVSSKMDFYFRFRVDVPSPTKDHTIVRKYAPSSNFLQSTWATTYIVDFRFNDVRSLPNEIIPSPNSKESEFVPIKKLHFFLMTKAHVDVEIGTGNIILRELEENTWAKYIEEKFSTKDIVAYHCSEKVPENKPPIRQWEFFAKLKVTNSALKTIIFYFIVLTGITVILNCLSNFVWEMIISNRWMLIAIIGFLYLILLYAVGRWNRIKIKRDKSIDKSSQK